MSTASHPHAESSGPTGNRWGRYLLAVVLLICAGAALYRATSMPGKTSRADRAQSPDLVRPDARIDDSGRTGSGQGEPAGDKHASCLKAEIWVRVLTVNGAPIVGAEVLCGLRGGKLSEEGPKSWLMGNGSVHAFGGHGFTGQKTTDAAGWARIRFCLPTRGKSKELWIEISPRAMGYVKDWNATYGINLPEEGTRKEVIMTLQPGKILRGRILGLDPDDLQHLLRTTVGEHDRLEDPDRSNGWYDILDVQPDGSFTSETAPLIALELTVMHWRKKYLPVRLHLQPPFDDKIEIQLQRNPGYREPSRAVIVIPDPPGGGKIEHFFLVYSETKKEVISPASSNKRVVSPEEFTLAPGSYVVYVFAPDEGLYGRATFTLADSERKEVAVPLRKGGAVRLRVREKDTGAIPDPKNLHVTLFQEMDGEYHNLKSLGYSRDDFRRSGEMICPGIPPGRNRITVGDFGERVYGSCSVDFSIGSGEEVALEALLERLK